MKRLFLILLLLSCGFLYAETKTFYVSDYILFSKDEPDEVLVPKTIKAILPYSDNVYVTKLDDLEIVIDKQFLFYVQFYRFDKEKLDPVYDVYQCNFESAGPNYFKINLIKKIKTVYY